jgi:hypothetical protein
LPTADGLRLVGELALPADAEPVATLICLHPLPTHGGMMDSHLLKKASFGTELALRWGLGDPAGRTGASPGIEGAILLSPPLHRSTDADLNRWAGSAKPLIALIPELDDYLRPDEARRRFARVPSAEVIAVDGAKHLWSGNPTCGSC